MMVNTTNNWISASTPPSTPSLEETFDSSLTTGYDNNKPNDEESCKNPAIDLARDDSLTTEPNLPSEDDIDLLFVESTMENSNLNGLMGDEIGKPGIALY